MKHRLSWTPQKIAARLELIRPLQHRRRVEIPAFRYAALAGPEAAAPVDPCIDDSDWAEIAPESHWGAWSTDFVLRSRFRVPEEWDDAPVALHLPLGTAGDIFTHPESLVYLDGVPHASADRYHHEIVLPSKCRDGAWHALALHGWTGLSGWPPDPDSETQLFMRSCAVVQIDPPTRALVLNAELALDFAGAMHDDKPEKRRILNALDAAFRTLDTRDPIGGEAFYDSVPAALKTLKDGLAEAGAPMDVDIVAVGHAHMDIAYLWRVAQARLKCGRTFSNVLRLMEAHPDYCFSHSQPQLYKFIEQDHPQIFEGIRTRVADGRWEPVGGMWVEADCNVTGAESLVRQLLLGRSYFRDRFGDAESPVLWLPDTFGFIWSLPQLMKQAGLKWFVTNKVSWNQVNPMPTQLTWWQGLDGTRVLAHFLTTPREVQYLNNPTTYKCDLSAAEVLGTWENFLQKEAHGELLLAYGYGDGGGGPTQELIEKAQVLSHMPGAPRVRMGTVREFFERVEHETAETLPVWNDEIYLELHRGTLTSQARTKRANRQCEVLLHDAEFLAAFAAVATGAAYPRADFAEAWELLCLNQFHDILPGVSITEVYEDCAADHARVRERAEAARNSALAALASDLPQDACAVAVNPTSFAGDRIGFLPGALDGGLADLRSGRGLATQAVDGGTLVELPELPAYALVALAAGAAPDGVTNLSVAEEGGAVVFENALLRVKFAPSGEMTSLFDKEVGREIVAPGGAGNRLLAFEDRPLSWDAWDIDVFYEDRVETIGGDVSRTLLENGPLRATVRYERTYRSSTVSQDISVSHNSKRIDFRTRIDWHESNTLLKVAFAVDVLSPLATYDIQWGNIQRTTHRNTTWDQARFEVAAHRWADLSEGGYGVALLNDCKYGYDIRDNVMRLSLLKSATMPDPIADQGEHVMTYSLLPHSGDWRNGVPAAACDLNDPAILRPTAGGAGEGAVHQLVSTDRTWAVIETVKAAEDGNGIIVRLYENERRRGPVTLRLGFDVSAVHRCNLLEETEEDLEVADNQVSIDLSPYEIVSLRCVPS